MVKTFAGRFALVAALTLLPAVIISAQGSPHVTGVEPASGKVNDSITVIGENLGKGSVTALYLSDEKSDYKATTVNQAPTKIVIKVPQVKAADYNISIRVGNSIFIQPVRFRVKD